MPLHLVKDTMIYDMAHGFPNMQHSERTSKPRDEYP